MRTELGFTIGILAATVAIAAQAPGAVDWSAVERESMDHFQAVLRFDTSDPPGNERPAAEYLKQVLEREGIATKVFELEPNRPNVVARLKGSGKKRPLLMMGHTDTVNVDPAKWTFPPFSATRDGGYVYGRGTVDDKDNVIAALMTMLLLKRSGVPLDRDVIFLAEAGEEGTTRVGIQFMVEAALRRDRRGVLPGRRRQRAAHRRTRAVCVGADGRKDSARHRADGDGHCRPRVGAARDQRDRPAVAGGGDGRGVEAADSAERHDARLLHAAGGDLAARRCGAISRGDRHRSEGGAGCGRLLREGRAAARVDAADVDLAEHHPGRLSHQRHSVGSEGDARRAAAVRARTRRRSSNEVRKVVNDPADPRRVDSSATCGRRRQARGSTPRCSRCSSRRSRATTTPPCCRR